MVIELAMSRVRQQQRILKENFLCDLLGTVGDDIRTGLLIGKVDPVYRYCKLDVLDALLYKVDHGRDAQYPPELQDSHRFRNQCLTEDNMKKTFDVYQNVASQYNHMSPRRLIDYLKMKKERNAKTHQAHSAIAGYLDSNRQVQNPQLSNFIANTYFDKPPAFNDNEITDMQPVFSKFARSINLPWKET